MRINVWSNLYWYLITRHNVPLLHKTSLICLNIFRDNTIIVSALKITTSQQSLTIATAFMTAKRLRWTVTMANNTQMQQQLLTTTAAITIFATSLKQYSPYFVIGKLSKPNLWREHCSGNLEYWGGL